MSVISQNKAHMIYFNILFQPKLSDLRLGSYKGKWLEMDKNQKPIIISYIPLYNSS